MRIQRYIDKFPEFIVDRKSKRKEPLRDNEVLKDCFDICCSNFSKENTVFFLLDKDGYILTSNDTEYEQIYGYKIKREKLDLGDFSETGRRVVVENLEGDIIVRVNSIVLYNNEEYQLCVLTDGNDKDEEESGRDFLANFSNQFIKCIEVVNRHLGNADFILKSLDSIEEGITICDRDGRLVYFNKITLNIMGDKVKEVLNKKMADYCDIKPLLYRVMEGKKRIIDSEYKFEFNNKKIHMISSGYPIYNENGEIIGAIDICNEIERSRKLANRIAGYNAVYRFDHILGKSDIIKEKISLAKTYSDNIENVLIQGESGTGKELFAQSIHNYSNRCQKPFIAINCANFPNELIESELFGYDEGAFTGARVGGKSGKFELADGGTLFLDEIGEMQHHLQAKLLRVLETKTINRVGGNKPISVDVRIISATNRDLISMIGKGQFRQDLYYRLKVLTVDIPPLRERGADVLEIANYFIKKIAEKYQKKILGINPEAQAMLVAYDWPGNIRELENLISRVIFICDSSYISKQHLIKAGLDESMLNKCKEVLNKTELMKINRDIISETLLLTGGNKRKAAELLGISRQTIYRALKNK